MLVLSSEVTSDVESDSQPQNGGAHSSTAAPVINGANCVEENGTEGTERRTRSPSKPKSISKLLQNIVYTVEVIDEDQEKRVITSISLEYLQ